MPTFTLTANDDTFDQTKNDAPDPNDDTIYGLAGDDSIFGSQGDDIIYGGDGSDDISSNFAILTPAVGGDTVYGGAGDDTVTTLGPQPGNPANLIASSVGDTVYGGDGNDSITGAVGVDDALADDAAQDDDFLFGGLGDDTIASNGGEDLIDAGAGTDFVAAGDGISTLEGGADTDTVSFASVTGSVVYDMTAGSATIAAGAESVTGFENAIGTGSDDTILGDAASNIIEGAAGNDTVTGGTASDTFIAGSGDDSVTGGEDVGDTDVDVYDFSGEATSITVVYTGDEAGSVTGVGTGIDTFAEIERIVFTAGDDAANAAAATTAVTLSTLGGDDFVESGQGADSLDGGADTDVLSYLQSPTPVTLDLATGTGTGGNAAGDTFVNFETFQLSNGADSVTGSAVSDTVEGEDGADTIATAGGDDSVDAGTGDDIVAGGTGADSMLGGAGFDTLDYSGSATAVTVDLSTQTATGGDATGDAFSGFEGIVGTGAGDTLTGAINANTIVAGGGDDIVDADGGVDSVDAGTGDDLVAGGDGDDSMDGGVGFDTLDYSDATGPVTVDLVANTATGAAGLDDFVNFEGIAGSGSDDTLTGDGTVNTIDGGAGDDTIDGGGGDDSLGGGDGDDLFTYDSGDGDDSITGGEGAEDEGGDTLTITPPTDGGFDVVYGGPGGAPSDDGSVFITDDTGATISTITFEDVENIVCFARGTMIETVEGPRAIEDLAPGDLVLTRDNGAQPIRWIGGQKVMATGRLAPVTIRAGALGNDRDLTVSQLHRMLVTDWRAELMFGEPEVLACAKHLVNGDSIFVAEGGEVEYFHMLFDGHEIVTANGALAESFHPGEQGMGWMEEAVREEIFAIFPQLRVAIDGFGPAARTSLKAYETRALRR